MVKPILIPTDKLSIEIGDLTLPNHPNKINEGELGIAVRSFVRNDAYKAYGIILIDTEAKIVEGNLCINKNLDTIYSPNCLGDTSDWIKIISSTNKSHNLPDLSNASKLILINYYNEHKCMPESVEVEIVESKEVICNRCDEQIDCTSKCMLIAGRASVNTIKINPQGEVDITIPEVKEKLYTEEEVGILFNSFAKDISHNAFMRSPLLQSDYIKFSIKWFNTKKK